MRPQHFSLSSRLQRNEAFGKEDRIDEVEKKPTRPAPAASTVGPCPTICQSSSTIARPNNLSIMIGKNVFN